MEKKETSEKLSSSQKESGAGLSTYELLTQRKKDRFEIPYGVVSLRRAPFMSFFISSLVLFGMG
ncbi:MAG: hypothetical protein AAF335_03450, partial [Bacteroidota bacterium]